MVFCTHIHMHLVVCTYALTRIYDCLLSAAATPGGQSFRRKQQRLPKHQQ